MANSTEVKFAQNLAANEKKKRDKSLKKLKKYLRLKSSKKDGFKEEDFLKLWKGLHYCMWMQDKPLIQEELSSTLSTLVHDLGTLEAKFLFVRTFFVTEAREWNSIDRWRIDKFMMLMRNILHEIFVFVAKEKWSDDSISHIVDVIGEMVLDHKKDSIPDGIRTHVADIYLAELKKVVSDQLEGKKLLKLLEPFCNFILKAQNTAIVKRVISRVFEPIISHAVNELRTKVEGLKEDTEEENESKMVKFDTKLLADHLFQLSNGSDCLTRNRPLVYDIVKRLQDTVAGVLPKDDKIVITPGLSRQDVSEAIQSLTKLQDSSKKPKKKKKRKKKDKENLDANNNEDGEETSEVNTDSQEEVDDQLEKVPKLGKRKHSTGSDKVTDRSEPHAKIKKKEKTSKHDSADTSIKSDNSSKINDKNAEKSSSDKEYASDSDKGDKKIESPHKRKHTGNLKSKTESINGSISEDSALVKEETAVANDSSAKKKRKRDHSESGKTDNKAFKTVIEVRKGKKKNAWTESPIESTDGANHSNNKVNNVNNDKLSNGNFDSGAIGSDAKDIKDIDKDEIVKSPKNQKEKSKGQSSESPEMGKNFKNKKSALDGKLESLESPKKKDTQRSLKSALHNKLTDDKNDVMIDETDCQDKKTNNSKISKAHVSDDLQESEIEIWVPNKKYKGNKPAGSSFAKFEKTKTPAAFVKKAYTKIKGRSLSSEDIKGKEDKSDTTGSTGTASGKKVQFDMKKNKALAFKDSLQISPVFPFHPDKKPEQGILKPSPCLSIGQRSSAGQRKHSLTPEQRSLPGSLRRSSLARPVSVLSTKQKRKSLPRAKASDFFL